jgi:hypothetical protein
LRTTGRVGAGTFLNIYLKKRMRTIHSVEHAEEKEEFKAYLHQIFLRPGSGEYALHSFLTVGAWAKKPLIDRIPVLASMGLSISFFYG